MYLSSILFIYYLLCISEFMKSFFEEDASIPIWIKDALHAAGVELNIDKPFE